MSETDVYEMPATLLATTIQHLMQTQTMAQCEGLVHRLRTLKPVAATNGTGDKEKKAEPPEVG